MRFELTGEQAGFAQSLHDLLARADTVAAARAWADGATGPGLVIWKRLADQGVSALVVPEEAGGLGGSLVDLAVAHEALGHHLAVGPWIESSAYLATALSGEAREAVAAGAVATVAAPPLVPFALDADVAEQVYVATDDRVHVARVGGVLPSIDRTRRLFEVEAGEVHHPADHAGAFETAVLACAAQLVGSGERVLADTVGYAKQRRQFGREIGSYQAVKHQLADVRIALDFARPVVFGAALGEVPVSAAKVAAADAAHLAARVGLQVHGAIGYTEEFDLSLWLTRIRALVGAWGTPAYHRGQVLDAISGGVLMGLARTEEQGELAATVRGLLAKRSDSAAVRAAVQTPEGYDTALWKALCEQVGVAALAIPEEYDGFGASLVETAVVLEELGENLTPAPLLASTLAAVHALLHGSEEERRELLPRLAAGAVVPFTLGAVVLEPGEHVGTMDQTLRLGQADPPVEPPADVRDVSIALVSALQVGAMQRAVDMTVAYSRERVQFGRPIGSFQALKHRMADMLVLLEAGRSASRGATAAAAAYLAEPGPGSAATLHRLAAVAGSYCSDALDRIASETVQLHGGVAITWEHDAQLVFKRAHALSQLNGPAHRNRAAALGALGP